MRRVNPLSMDHTSVKCTDDEQNVNRFEKKLDLGAINADALIDHECEQWPIFNT